MHSSWPIGIIRRLGSISTSSEAALKARDQLILRFENHLAFPSTVRLLRQTEPWRVCYRHGSLNSSPTFWLKLGFHPGIAKHVQRALSKFLKDSGWQILLAMSFGTNYRVRVAWANRLPSLLNIANSSLERRPLH